MIHFVQITKHLQGRMYQTQATNFGRTKSKDEWWDTRGLSTRLTFKSNLCYRPPVLSTNHLKKPSMIFLKMVVQDELHYTQDICRIKHILWTLWRQGNAISVQSI